MKPLPIVTRTIAFGLGAAGTLLLLELLLRVLPVFGGLYAADPRPDWPIHTLIPNTRYTYSSGWNLQNVHEGRINNYGYLSPDDYQPGSGGIAVFGDSYIESVMNDYDDTLQGELAKQLRARRPVMNFGTAGAELPHYLGAAEWVANEFQPEWAVFLITAGDFTRGFKADPGYFYWNPGDDPPIAFKPEPHRSGLTKFVRSLALVRYLRGNLSFQPGNMLVWRRTVEPPRQECEPGVLSKDDESLLAGFVEHLPRTLKLPPERVVLVFDSDRKAIYAGRSQQEALRCAARPMLANERLKELARARGMRVVDSYPVFDEYFRRHGLPVDRAPFDAHWNPTAHRLMAAEVARIIEPARVSQTDPG
jgi:hypothetical protein